ncbi:MAG: pyridoxal-phosphate dependent enzyme [Nitrosopumilus sp. H8]|nr:MAG: pyridoxal-phosphate dependent enzyme [Nitrosopumilus sp. H13]RNJ79008.1 MAG: pyridoxal-phosphate dependent enzyme [Nitrosopumilus sp. H8]
MPHEEGGSIVNATSLSDITADIKECARLYNMELGGSARIFAKFDSELMTGSIKARPAVHILHEAIKSGKLRGGQVVIEATSGNFGIALGRISRLGLVVVSLVSRKLQEGVFAELRNGEIKVMDLDMDVCPAPGMKGDADAMAAKAAAANIRSQIAGLGFDTGPFDGAAQEIESLLGKQDVINLAKLLARTYGFFCPEQYDNELNIDAHSAVTAPEIDSQLKGMGTSLGNADVVCAFGTGGTSGGLSRYASAKYGKKTVHVVFPPAGQDVAGIRTKATASGLSMYRPELYAAEHEVDFGKARQLLRFLVKRGHDIGESSALALYCAMQMAADGGEFVVIVADGIAKYKKSLEEQPRMQVSLQEAAAGGYDRIIWVHAQYTPREEGIKAIAKSLGVDESRIHVPKASTIAKLLATQQVPDELQGDLEGSKKPLLVCMAGNTSLMTAKVLAGKGIMAESLNGGIMELAGSTNPGELIRQATE